MIQLTPGCSFPIIHHFTHFTQMGGVESWLQIHSKHCTRFGLNETFISVFDSAQNQQVFSLYCSGFSTIFGARRRFRRLAAQFPDAVHVYHNLWGLHFLADLDCAKRRIGFVHSRVDEIKSRLEQNDSKYDSLVTVSDDLANWIHSVIPEFPREKIYVLPNPVEAKGLSTPKVGKSTEKIHLGYSGRLVRDLKRIDRLPRLLQLLNARNLDYVFHVMGDGPEMKWLANISRNCPNLILHGRMTGDTYHRQLANIDALVFFSDVEGLPMSLIEGLAVGVPSFFPEIGSEAVQLMRNMHDRLIYPSGDLENLANQIHSTAKHCDWTALQISCRKAAEPFALDRHFQLFTKILQHTVADSTGKANRSRFARGHRLGVLGFIPYGILKRCQIHI